jgi:hypothetical protein
MRFFGSWLSLSARARDRERANGITDSVGQLREPPIALAEVILAWSFPDFGAIPDARYFHTLYDWRLSERAESSDDVPPSV